MQRCRGIAAAFTTQPIEITHVFDYCSEQRAIGREIAAAKLKLRPWRFKYALQTFAQFREILRPHFAIFLLPGKTKRIDMALDDVATIFRAIPDGVENQA